MWIVFRSGFSCPPRTVTWPIPNRPKKSSTNTSPPTLFTWQPWYALLCCLQGANVAHKSVSFFKDIPLTSSLLLLPYSKITEARSLPYSTSFSFRGGHLCTSWAEPRCVSFPFHKQIYFLCEAKIKHLNLIVEEVSRNLWIFHGLPENF